MPERELKKKSPSRRHDEEVEQDVSSANTGEKLKDELDDLLDELDDVLETNAEDFVKSYIQKGGE